MSLSCAAVRPVLLLSALLSLSGCATSGGELTEADDGATIVSPNAYAAQLASLPSPAIADSNSTDYRIGQLDKLEVTVFQAPELSKTVQVGTSGDIRLPLIGVVAAEGKTVRELEGDIKRRLEKDYLQSAQVGVHVTDALSQQVTVNGAVTNPGVYSTSKGQASLLQVVSMAGGPTRLANTQQVLVFRDVDGKRNAAVFNYAAIKDGRQEDPRLQGGDIVVVDESGAKAAWRGVIESAAIISIFSPL